MRQENVVDTLVSAPNQGNTTIFACHLLQNWLARNIPYLQKHFILIFNLEIIPHKNLKWSTDPLTAKLFSTFNTKDQNQNTLSSQSISSTEQTVLSNHSLTSWMIEYAQRPVSNLKHKKHKRHTPKTGWHFWIG